MVPVLVTAAVGTKIAYMIPLLVHWFNEPSVYSENKQEGVRGMVLA